MLAAVGVAATAGCLTDPGDGPGGESTTTTTTATTVYDGTTSTNQGDTPRTESRERKTTRSTTETTPEDWIEHASNQPDPDHDITLANEAAESKTVRLWVERDETGETVFETTETVDPGVEFTVWNLKKASPDGVETFTVCAELVGSSESTTETKSADAERTTTASEDRDCAPLHTNECYGNSHVTVREDGTLQIIYSIC